MPRDNLAVKMERSLNSVFITIAHRNSDYQGTRLWNANWLRRQENPKWSSLRKTNDIKRISQVNNFAIEKRGKATADCIIIIFSFFLSFFAFWNGNKRRIKLKQIIFLSFFLFWNGNKKSNKIETEVVFFFFLMIFNVSMTHLCIRILWPLWDEVLAVSKFQEMKKLRIYIRIH